METELATTRQRVNLNQGMRRLAIFAGMLGAVAGGVYAYRTLRNVPSQRYQHKVFEALVASDIVTREHWLLQMAKDNGTIFSWPLTTEVDELKTNRPKSATVLANEIKTIFWKPDLTVDFFGMEDGGIVESGPSPNVWCYLLWAVFPSLGFVISWAAIRGITWVGAGFFQTPK